MKDDDKIVIYMVSLGLMAIYLGVAILCYDKIGYLMWVFFLTSLLINLYIIRKI